MGKKWTMLLYLNGHNELEPEMWEAVLALKKMRSVAGVNVVAQIGREHRDLARLLRPRECISLVGEEWTGVRRYVIHPGHSELVEDLGLVNLADPMQLQAFICWGVTQYPAESLLLAIGGHAISVVGLTTDYSQDRPYTMTVQGLAAALTASAAKIGKAPDLLLLDTCNANSVEILYELSQARHHQVGTVITYTAGAPISGMPYQAVAAILSSPPSGQDCLTRALLSAAGPSSVALTVDGSCLERVKSLANDIAGALLDAQPEGASSRPPGPEDLSLHFRHLLSESMRPLILSHQPPIDGPLITIAAERLPPLLVPLYRELAFARDNRWTELLSGVSAGGVSGNHGVSPAGPLELPLAAVYACIVRMNLDKAHQAPEVDRIFRQLLADRKWTAVPSRKA